MKKITLLVVTGCMLLLSNFSNAKTANITPQEELIIKMSTDINVQQLLINKFKFQYMKDLLHANAVTLNEGDKATLIDFNSSTNELALKMGTDYPELLSYDVDTQKLIVTKVIENNMGPIVLSLECIGIAIIAYAACMGFGVFAPKLYILAMCSTAAVAGDVVAVAATGGAIAPAAAEGVAAEITLCAEMAGIQGKSFVYCTNGALGAILACTGLSVADATVTDAVDTVLKQN